jgi:prepilin-type N-terminal cleavage/methylation domain-containing protein
MSLHRTTARRHLIGTRERAARLTRFSNSKTLRTAFTLLELLVVVCIITVLASLLLPAITQVKRQAKLAQCSANLHAIGEATFAYMADEGGKFPFDNPPGYSQCWPQMGVVDIWRLLKPSIPDASFYICPADFDPAFTFWWVQTSGASYGYPNLSALDFPSSYYYLYCCYHRFDPPSASTNSEGPHARQMFLKDVLIPNKKAIFVCYCRGSGYGSGPGPFGLIAGSHGGDGYNLEFADGHAAWSRFVDLYPAQTPDNTGPYNLDWCKGGLAGHDLK